MPPPKLPTDAPVLNVVHPFEVSLRPVLGNKSNLATLNSFDSRFGQRFDFHVPLVSEIRFDNGVTAVASRNFYNIVFNFFQQIELFKFPDDSFACVEAIHAAIPFGNLIVECRVVVQDVVHRQLVALADFIIIEVVGRCYFYAARTELGVDVVV